MTGHVQDRVRDRADGRNGEIAKTGKIEMSGSLAMARSAPDATASPAERPRGPSGRHVLTAADYLGADGGLRLATAEASHYADAAPSTLFTEPAYLRAYEAGALLLVEAQPGRDAPRLVFTRAKGGLIHQGRLARVDETLVSSLADQLMAKAGAGFVVFEDVECAVPLPRGPRRFVFHYQNNWRLPLSEREAQVPPKVVANTKRCLRNLARDNPGVALRFEAAPQRSVLDAITAFGRIRIEGQGRRYGIDDSETVRLAAVASEVGHSSILTMGDTILAADLICRSGDQAYFLTHGYHPGYPTSSLGKITLINSIEASRAAGIVDFNLMWGDLPYKAQVGATCIPLQTVVTRRSRLGLIGPGHLATVLHFARLDLKRRLRPAIHRLRTRIAERRGSAVRGSGR